MPEKNPQNRRLGYARVRPTGRRLARSLTSYERRDEKAKGAQADRRELLRPLRAIGPGDAA